MNFRNAEQELINDYKSACEKVRDLKRDQDYFPDLFSAAKSEELKAESEKLSNLKENLKNLEERPISENTRRCLIDQITEIIKKLKVSEYGLNLSLNQGMVFELWLFQRIMDFIYITLDRPYGVSSPQFYYERESTFDHTSLKQVLLSTVEKLSKLEQPTFIQIESVINDLNAEIKTLAEQEYKRLHPH